MSGINKPFLMFNPKSYFFGYEVMEVAAVCDKFSKKFDVDVIVTSPTADIYRVASVVDKIIVSSQHLDGGQTGKEMSSVFAESIRNAGARAVVLNHAERPLTISNLIESIQRANELEMITIVCANSLEEIEAVATLNPDIILCEQDKLAGTGRTSSAEYVKESIKLIKNINPEIYVMQGAGVKEPADVSGLLDLGADGVCITSSVTEADKPSKMLEEMIKVVAKFKEN